MKLRCIIVDDEPPARAKIRKFLQARQDVEVVAEASDGLEAIERILRLKPELVFLDIQMPRGDGFDVLKAVYPEHKPMIIFTTAFDEYAVRGFEVEAVDYLLKPFTADRFHSAVERSIKSLASRDGSAPSLARLLQGLPFQPNRVQRVLVRTPASMFFLKAADIDWIEAEEKYVLLHTGAQSHMVRQSIGALESQLAPACFVRIHRCHLLNLEALKEVCPLAHGDCVAVLKSGTRLKIGRNYKDALLRAMGASLQVPPCQ